MSSKKEGAALVGLQIHFELRGRRGLGIVAQADRGLGFAELTAALLQARRSAEGRPFTVKIGTVFESSHLGLHLWLQAIYLVSSAKRRVTIRELQQTLDAVRRIREARADKRKSA